jgi:hypothetical protein
VDEPVRFANVLIPLELGQSGSLRLYGAHSSGRL